MLCAVIKGPTFEDVRKELAQARVCCSLVDFRLDLCEEFKLSQLRTLRQEFPIPMIFNLRSSSQGGKYTGSETQREEKIRELAVLSPEYIDLGYQVTPAFANSLKLGHPSIRLISSYYDQTHMPSLPLIFDELKKIDADLYELAITPSSSSEALILLEFMKKNQPGTLAMALGPYGPITRILSPIFGGLFVHATLDKGISTFPGRLSAYELTTVYHYEKLNDATALYGSISTSGEKNEDPVLYNAALHLRTLPAVFLNFPLKSEELSEFLGIAKRVGISGLNVSKDLQRKIIPYLDFLDSSAKTDQTVDTLLFENQTVKGFHFGGFSEEEKLKNQFGCWFR